MKVSMTLSMFFDVWIHPDGSGDSTQLAGKTITQTAPTSKFVVDQMTVAITAPLATRVTLCQSFALRVSGESCPES